MARHRTFLRSMRLSLQYSMFQTWFQNWFLICAGILPVVEMAAAEPIVEKGERAEVNWSDLEVRYFGEATPEQQERESFKGTERRAWQDGMAAIEETLQLLGKGRIGMHVSAPRGSASVGSARATSRSTTYFGDGKVRVYLQSPLQQVVVAALGEVSFSEAKPLANTTSVEGAYTGVVIQLGKKMAPMAVYKIFDESGERLFSLEDMSESGFRQSLMGRWFRRAGSAEIVAHVGDNPLIIKGKPSDSDNKIIIERSAWDATGRQAGFLLASGRAIISTP